MNDDDRTTYRDIYFEWKIYWLYFLCHFSSLDSKLEVLRMVVIELEADSFRLYFCSSIQAYSMLYIVQNSGYQEHGQDGG